MDITVHVRNCLDMGQQCGKEGPCGVSKVKRAEGPTTLKTGVKDGAVGFNADSVIPTGDATPASNGQAKVGWLDCINSRVFYLRIFLVGG